MFASLSFEWGMGKGEGEELTLMGLLLGCKWLIHQPLSFPFDVCFPLFGMGMGRRREEEEKKEGNSP
jgi:hypothetical protein